MHVHNNISLAQIQLPSELNKFSTSQLRILLFTAPIQIIRMFWCSPSDTQYTGCWGVVYHFSLYFNGNKTIICHLARGVRIRDYRSETLPRITRSQGLCKYIVRIEKRSFKILLLVGNNDVPLYVLQNLVNIRGHESCVVVAETTIIGLNSVCLHYQSTLWDIWLGVFIVSPLIQYTYLRIYYYNERSYMPNILFHNIVVEILLTVSIGCEAIFHSCISACSCSFLVNSRISETVRAVVGNHL